MVRLLTAEEIARATTFTALNLPTAYLELTQTGLDKSIMDATDSVRRFFSDSGIHSYGSQAKGTGNKVTITASFVHATGEIHSTTVSLYRPQTKNGDPRIWIYGLKERAKAGDVVVLTQIANQLWVSNLTRVRLDQIAKGENALSDALTPAFVVKTLVVDELTAALQEIWGWGFLPSPGAGDTMVGRVLESALGIEANSSRAPDFHGIELKAYRLRPNTFAHAMKRRNLFAKTPAWSRSTLKSSRAILESFGYVTDDVLRLYCEVRATKFNTQGLRLEHDQRENAVREVSNRLDLPDVVVWPLEELEGALSQKHAETFWIGAESKKIDGHEFFRYVVVEHTQQPLVEQFGPLVDMGAISVDHLIKEKDGRVTEKGPIFKIDNSAASLLFPSPRVFNLNA
jgi:hypothetical protein